MVSIVIGGTDTGKSTLARELFRRACGEGRRAAFVDGDPGQSVLGPPTTMTVAMGEPGDGVFPPRGRRWCSFVGSISPIRHMLPMLVSAARLVNMARRAGADEVIFDTTGFIDPLRGGDNLKFAKIDLLQPSTVYAIQRNGELEPILKPLRCTGRVQLVESAPSSRVQPRDPETRRLYRAERFARYFAGAAPLAVIWPELAVFPGPEFSRNRLIALEDCEGFTRGLGIVVEGDATVDRLTVLTPLRSLQDVDALRVGGVEVDPTTFSDRWPGRER